MEAKSSANGFSSQSCLATKTLSTPFVALTASANLSGLAPDTSTETGSLN